jgi:toxin ParE1/3/4
MKVRIARKALTDIDAIRDYTVRTWGAGQARDYVRRIHDAIQRAGRTPERFSLIAEGERYRRVPTGSHHIYFRIEGDTIFVVRVLHERMDIDAQLD